MDVTDLGKVLGEYRISQRNYWLTACYLLAVGAYGVWDQFQAGDFRLGFMVMVVLAWACAGFLLWLLQRNLQAIMVYEQGLQLISRSGTQFVPWQQLDTIRREASDRFIELRIIKPDSQFQRVRIRRMRQPNDPNQPAYLSFNALYQLIAEQSFDARYETAKQHYLAGERLGFGPISLSNQGFYFKDAFLPWDQVQALDTNSKQDFLAIMQQGQSHSWALLTLNELSNLDLFLALLAEFHREFVQEMPAE